MVKVLTMRKLATSREMPAKTSRKMSTKLRALPMTLICSSATTLPSLAWYPFGRTFWTALATVARSAPGSTTVATPVNASWPLRKSCWARCVVKNT